MAISMIETTKRAVTENAEWAQKAFSGTDARDLPFDFQYGGKSFRSMMHAWKTQTSCHESADNLHYILTCTDPDSGLTVIAEVTVYTDTPGTDWIICFTNSGSKQSEIIDQVKAVSVSYITTDNDLPVFHYMKGTGPGNTICRDDFMPKSCELPRCFEMSIAPSDGRSSDGVMPFMNLQHKDGGIITAIGWTGQWRSWVKHSADGTLSFEAGMEQMHLRLEPGESIRSPRILQIRWSGNDHLPSYNLLRQTMISHILPRVNDEPAVPPIAGMSAYFDEGISQTSTESSVLSCIEPMKDIGFEAVWVDACWMRRYGMGDYGFPIERVEDKTRFPNGLKPIGDAARNAGMKFILWFAPEDVLPGSFIIDEHPEWVIFPGIQKNAPGDNQYGYGMYDLSIPEARKYLTEYLKTVIREYGMDCLRVDRGWFGGPLPCWQIKDGNAPDRIGISEIRGVEGLYKMWDDILAEFPHLFIDNCSGGGRRIDLETCARSIPLWATDYTTWSMLAEERKPESYNPVSIQNQIMICGLSRYVPMWSTGVMGIDPYWMRSARTAGIPFCEDIRPADYPKDELTAAMTECKRVRKYYFGNFYPLSPITDSSDDWCVLQYHRTNYDDGMILAFRRHDSNESEHICHPYEIDPDAEYEISIYYNYDRYEIETISGNNLQDLKISIIDQPGSVLMEYRKHCKE